SQRRPVRAPVDHRHAPVEPALHRRGRADVARARSGDGRAREGGRRAARQRGTAALGGPVHGGGPDRPRPRRRHQGLQRRRGAEQRLVESELATRVLAGEQAALRRIATLVASEAAPSSVFEQVTEEVASLLEAPIASVVRYEADATATVVGTWTEAGSAGI